MPPAPLHVLVVDDSVVMRRVVARALERDDGIGVTSFAGNGRQALAKIADRRPDAVVLDLEMPELDGFGTLAELKRLDPTLPVVLFSSMDERGAAVTLELLSLGAKDFVVKPSASSVEEAEAYVAEHLTPLIKALAGPRDQLAPVRRQQAPVVPAAVSAIVVGVSTGGPDALVALLKDLPPVLRVPVLVVQHMPPMFTRLLAERLNRMGRLPVTEAEDGTTVAPGSVYIAPGDRHLHLTRTGDRVRVRLGDEPAENSCRPAADVLFRSAVEVYGAGVVAVVLTGMGHDGLRGCQAVRAAGGHVVVQDPSTAVVGSMPGAVLAAGLAHVALPLEEVAAELVGLVLGAAAR